jgi:hypothetical protein
MRDESGHGLIDFVHRVCADLKHLAPHSSHVALACRDDEQAILEPAELHRQEMEYGIALGKAQAGMAIAGERGDAGQAHHHFGVGEIGDGDTQVGRGAIEHAARGLKEEVGMECGEPGGQGVEVLAPLGIAHGVGCRQSRQADQEQEEESHEVALH